MQKKAGSFPMEQISESYLIVLQDMSIKFSVARSRRNLPFKCHNFVMRDVSVDKQSRSIG